MASRQFHVAARSLGQLSLLIFALPASVPIVFKTISKALPLLIPPTRAKEELKSEKVRTRKGMYEKEKPGAALKTTSARGGKEKPEVAKKEEL